MIVDYDCYKKILKECEGGNNTTAVAKAVKLKQSTASTTLKRMCKSYKFLDVHYEPYRSHQRCVYTTKPDAYEKLEAFWNGKQESKERTLARIDKEDDEKEKERKALITYKSDGTRIVNGFDNIRPTVDRVRPKVYVGSTLG